VSVAPDAWRRGDLSTIGQTIRDPRTGQPFPGNQIPLSRISPVALAILNNPNYPSPNRTVSGGVINNYVGDALTTGLLKNKIRTARIDGSVTGPRREQVIADFQAGRITALVVQIKAAGIGVTLTRAADLIFVQVPWSAGDLAQMAGRILRADQMSMERASRGERVTWHVLQAAKEDGKPTFDMAMWDVLESKAHVCDAVNAGKPITMPDGSVMQQAMQSWYHNAT
jgi:hypothetical protein